MGPKLAKNDKAGGKKLCDLLTSSNSPKLFSRLAWKSARHLFCTFDIYVGEGCVIGDEILYVLHLSYFACQNLLLLKNIGKDFQSMPTSRCRQICKQNIMEKTQKR